MISVSAIFYEDPSIYKNISIWTPNAQVLRKTRMYGRKGLEISKLSYNNCFAISRLSVWLLNNSLTSSNFCSLIWKMRNPNLMIFKAFSSSFEFCMQSIVVKSTEMMLNCFVPQINHFSSLISLITLSSHLQNRDPNNTLLQ